MDYIERLNILYKENVKKMNFEEQILESNMFNEGEPLECDIDATLWTAFVSLDKRVDKIEELSVLSDRLTSLFFRESVSTDVVDIEDHEQKELDLKKNEDKLDGKDYVQLLYDISKKLDVCISDIEVNLLKIKQRIE